MSTATAEPKAAEASRDPQDLKVLDYWGDQLTQIVGLLGSIDIVLNHALDGPHFEQTTEVIAAHDTTRVCKDKAVKLAGQILHAYNLAQAASSEGGAA